MNVCVLCILLFFGECLGLQNIVGGLDEMIPFRDVKLERSR